MHLGGVEPNPAFQGELTFGDGLGVGDLTHHRRRNLELLAGVYPPVGAPDRHRAGRTHLGDRAGVGRLDDVPRHVHVGLNGLQALGPDQGVVLVGGQDVGLNGVAGVDVAGRQLDPAGVLHQLRPVVGQAGGNVGGAGVDRHRRDARPDHRADRLHHRHGVKPVDRPHPVLRDECAQAEESAGAAVNLRADAGLLRHRHREHLVARFDAGLVDRVRLLAEVAELKFEVLHGGRSGQVQEPLERHVVPPDRGPLLGVVVRRVRPAEAVLPADERGHVDRVVQAGGRQLAVLVADHRVGVAVDGRVGQERRFAGLPVLDFGHQVGQGAGEVGDVARPAEADLGGQGGGAAGQFGEHHPALGDHFQAHLRGGGVPPPGQHPNGVPGGPVAGQHRAGVGPNVGAVDEGQPEPSGSGVVGQFGAEPGLAAGGVEQLRADVEAGAGRAESGLPLHPDPAGPGVLRAEVEVPEVAAVLVAGCNVGEAGAGPPVDVFGDHGGYGDRRHGAGGDGVVGGVVQVQHLAAVHRVQIHLVDHLRPAVGVPNVEEQADHRLRVRLRLGLPERGVVIVGGPPGVPVLDVARHHVAHDVHVVLERPGLSAVVDVAPDQGVAQPHRVGHLRQHRVGQPGQPELHLLGHDRVAAGDVLVPADGV